jgi:single-strand DNA-binding protein
MPNVNKFYGVGHLGKDPEVRVTQSGTSVASFSVGITISEKQNGEWVKVTEWFNCVCFGKQAEWLSDAQKGDLCLFSGRIKTETYEKDGQKHYITKVICDDVQTVRKSAKPQELNSGNSFSNQSDAGFDDLSDDIPF